MIRLEPAPEPAEFDTRVRQPGLAAIAELVGEGSDRSRPGSTRKKVAERREGIPADAYPPLWRHALPYLLESYHRVCAYLSLYIEEATGAATVDHFIPKAKAWDTVYEWSNYRLACALMNARKGDSDRVLDPFEIHDDWFDLDLVGYQIKVGAAATGAMAKRVEATIEQLGLNRVVCLKARQHYVESYLGGHIGDVYLRRRAPFIARELERQGYLVNIGK